MINVLHLVAHGVKGEDGAQGVNGPELRTLNSLSRFDFNRFNMFVTYSSQGKLWKDFNDSGVPVIDYSVKGKFDWKAVDFISRTIRKYNIRVVHTQGPGSLDMYAAASAGRTGAKIVVTRPIMISDLKVAPAKRFFYEIADRYTLKNADRIIAVSKAGRNHLIDRCRAVPDKTVLVYNGIDLSRFDRTQTSPRNLWNIPEDVPVVGACAQLTENKGWKDFLRAFVMLRERIPQIRGMIIGDGPLREELEKHVRKAGLEDAVIFTGNLKRVEMALQCLDLFLFLSHREGLSVAVIEALACGLPCVVTDVGGAKEQVEQGKNGYVVPRGDVSKATEHAEYLLNNKDLLYKTGRVSREICEKRFDVSRMVKDYESVYMELAESKKVEGI